MGIVEILLHNAATRELGLHYPIRDLPNVEVHFGKQGLDRLRESHEEWNDNSVTLTRSYRFPIVPGGAITMHVEVESVGPLERKWRLLEDLSPLGNATFPALSSSNSPPLIDEGDY